MISDFNKVNDWNCVFDEMQHPQCLKQTCRAYSLSCLLKTSYSMSETCSRIFVTESDETSLDTSLNLPEVTRERRTWENRWVATSEESCRNLAITNIGVGVKSGFYCELIAFPPMLGWNQYSQFSSGNTVVKLIWDIRVHCIITCMSYYQTKEIGKKVCHMCGLYVQDIAE
jgi:hypothetical protein